MDAMKMRAFAALALDGGIGELEGTKLLVRGDFPHRALMYEIARLAYARGASLVRLVYEDRPLLRIRAESSREEYLDEAHEWAKRESETFAAESWACLYIDGEEDPEALAGADQGRIARIQAARSEATKAYRGAMMASKARWCVIPAATDAWARAVLGPEAGSAELWRVLEPILGLDAADPGAAQKSRMALLEARGRELDALALRELRFEAPGTRLRVALAPESRWLGGGDRTPAGEFFMPNIPTEECFATPDYRGTEGVAAVTRPLRVLGELVVGAKLRFEAGVLVEARAERGEEALRRFVDIDPGARRLGEVALVDSANPIAASGLLFDNILLDENAACHIALGAGYEAAFAGSDSWDEEEKLGRGFNPSLVHEDFMIGSPALDVTGVDASGRELPLLKGGSFVRSGR